MSTTNAATTASTTVDIPRTHFSGVVERLPPHVRQMLVAASVMLAAIIQILDTTIANVALPHMQASPGATSAWHLFVVRVCAEKRGIDRARFMADLKQRNIGTGIHFLATHTQKYYVEQLGCRRGSLPNTEWNSDRICSLPLFPDMRDGDVDDVVGAIKDMLSKA